MKITTFYWRNKPIEMILISTHPRADDNLGYCLFGFDAFDVLLAIDAITPADAQVCRENLERGFNMPRRASQVLLSSFAGEDLITEGDLPLYLPYVTSDGIGKLGDLLPEKDQSEWFAFARHIMQTMQLCTLYLKKAIADRSYDVEIEINGKKEVRQSAPSLPIRSMALVIQKQLSMGSMDEATEKTGLAACCVENQETFVSENDLAIALSNLTDKSYTPKSVRMLLVERGYLVAKKAGARVSYELSKQGEGYAAVHRRKHQWERHWHVSIVKLLEAKQ